jgi:hypothetical protein
MLEVFDLHLVLLGAVRELDTVIRVLSDAKDKLAFTVDAPAL